MNKLLNEKFKKATYKTISKVKLSKEEKKQRLKEYNHNYYMAVIK